MSLARYSRVALAAAAAASLSIVAISATAIDRREERAPLTLGAARVIIEGTSNLHPYTATSTAVRLTRVRVGEGIVGPGFWDAVLEPGALQTFEVAVPVATLSSPKEGLDKNMFKALKAEEHPEITFKLTRLQRGKTADAFQAVGTLRIAGVEREVTLDIRTKAKDDAMTVQGEVRLLMTDFGIAPPKAMLGMLKTDPKVTVRFEALLAISLT